MYMILQTVKVLICLTSSIKKYKCVSFLLIVAVSLYVFCDCVYLKLVSDLFYITILRFFGIFLVFTSQYSAVWLIYLHDALI